MNQVWGPVAGIVPSRYTSLTGLRFTVQWIYASLVAHLYLLYGDTRVRCSTLLYYYSTTITLVLYLPTAFHATDFFVRERNRTHHVPPAVLWLMPLDSNNTSNRPSTQLQQRIARLPHVVAIAVASRCHRVALKGRTTATTAAATPSTATPQTVTHSARAAHSASRTRAGAKGDTQKEARNEHCKNRRGSRVQRV